MNKGVLSLILIIIHVHFTLYSDTKIHVETVQWIIKHCITALFCNSVNVYIISTQFIFQEMCQIWQCKLVVFFLKLAWCKGILYLRYHLKLWIFFRFLGKLDFVFICIFKLSIMNQIMILWYSCKTTKNLNENEWHKNIELCWIPPLLISWI